MEMPTSCGECLFKHLSPTGESIVCDLDLSTVSWESRPFDCPLVPVPPHGRLIDADELIKSKEEISYKDEWHMTSTGYYVSVNNIDAAPTILEAEEDET